MEESAVLAESGNSLFHPSSNRQGGEDLEASNPGILLLRQAHAYP